MIQELNIIHIIILLLNHTYQIPKLLMFIFEYLSLFFTLEVRKLLFDISSILINIII